MVEGKIEAEWAPGALLSKRQIAAVVAGNALEFYDFLIFSFFALPIGRAFFPSSRPEISLLAALATFGAGFLTRPLGGIVIGLLANRAGRKLATRPDCSGRRCATWSSGSVSPWG